MSLGTLNTAVNISDYLIDGSFDVPFTLKQINQKTGKTAVLAEYPTVQGIFRQKDDLSIGTGSGQTSERRQVRATYAEIKVKTDATTQTIDYQDELVDPAGKSWYVYDHRFKGSGLMVLYVCSEKRAANSRGRF